MFLLLIPDDGPKWPKHVCLKTYLKKKKATEECFDVC